MEQIKGFLIDLDGVLYIEDKPVPGAAAVLRQLAELGYMFRGVSNTTQKSGQTITANLFEMGLDIPDKFVFTPAIAAVAYMKQKGIQSCSLLTTGDSYNDFGDFCIQEHEKNPNVSLLAMPVTE